MDLPNEEQDGGMTLRELTALADDAVRNALEDSTKIATIREEAYKYYTLQLPIPPTKYDANRGEWVLDGSGYITGDVLDAVEQIKAAVLDAYCANNDPVILEPQGHPAVEQIDGLISEVFYRENKGEQILYDAVHEGLLAKVGVVRAFLDTSPVEVEGQAQVDEQTLAALLATPGVEIKQIQEAAIQTPMGIARAFAVTYTLVRPANKIKLQNLLSEDFFILGTGLDEGEWDAIGHQERILEDDLIAAGFDPAIVKRLPDERYYSSENTRSARNSFDEEDTDHDRSGQRNYKRVTHIFIRADVDGDGRVETVYLMYGYTSRDALKVEVVDTHWYECFAPYRIPGKFYGLSEFELMQSIQDANSHTQRQILNKMLAANRARIEITKGAVEDVDDARRAAETIGECFIVNRPDGIREISALPMPAETGLQLELLQRDKEARSGYSRTAQGMNPDVISQQNAKDMIENYVNLGQKRVAMMIRSNLKNFLIPIFRRIYQLAKDNAQVFDGYQVDIGGVLRPIYPSTWPQVSIEGKAALTPDEQMDQANKLLAVDARLSQDQGLGAIYQPQNRYYVLSTALDLMQLPVSRILTAPGTPEHQQAMMAQQQAAMQQAQVAQAQLQAQLAQVAKQLEAVDTQIAKTKADMMREAMDSGVEREVKQDQQDLKENEFAWQQQKDQAEIALEATQKRPVSL